MFDWCIKDLSPTLLQPDTTMDNYSNGTEFRPPQRLKPLCDQNCWLVFNIFVFVAGFAGNGSIIYITARHKGLRTIPNLLITNLAFGDLMFIILVVFMNILLFAVPELGKLKHGCEYMFFIQLLTLGVSVLTLTALSVDRLITVVKPMYKQRENVKVRTIVAVFIIWVISCIIAAPVFYLFNVDRSRPCRWPTGYISYSVYLVFFFLIFYALPTIIMVTCYTMTARKLLRKSQLLNRDSRGGLRQHQQRSRLAIIVLIMTIAFIICSSIFFFRTLVENFAPKHPLLKNIALAETMVLLLKLNSCINPVILYLMSTTHRRYFLRHFCCCVVPKEVTRPRTTTNGTSSQVTSNTWMRSTKLGMKPTNRAGEKLSAIGVSQQEQLQQQQPLNPSKNDTMCVAKL